MTASAPPSTKPTKPRAPRKPRAKAQTPTQMASPELQHVHETEETVAAVELTPPHPPREDTPEYQQTHKLLVFEKDTPCRVCKVRHSDLQDPHRASDPKINKAGAKAIETHHFPCERSLVDALDWRKVHEDFPAVYSQASLIMWVDSPENMLVLCDVHHRSPEAGIHHLLTQDFAVAPYLLDGYKVVATAKDATVIEAADEAIERATGIEQLVDAPAAASESSSSAPASHAAVESGTSKQARGAGRKPRRKKQQEPAAAVPATVTPDALGFHPGQALPFNVAADPNGTTILYPQGGAAGVGTWQQVPAVPVDLTKIVNPTVAQPAASGTYVPWPGTALPPKW